MRSFARWLFTALSACSAVACLDLTASVVEKVTSDASPGTTAACLKCLQSSNATGSGCGEQLATCQTISLCAMGVACTFNDGCYNEPVEEVRAFCIRSCADRVGFRSIGSPATAVALPWYDCATTHCHDECGTDDDAGTDGSSPDASVPDASMPDGGPDATSDVSGGACTNAADQTIQADANFAAVPRDCGFMCFGLPDPTCSARCMETKGLTSACAACWGDTINCGSKNCLGMCLDSNSPACLACTAQYCDPAFHACAGP